MPVEAGTDAQPACRDLGFPTVATAWALPWSPRTEHRGVRNLKSNELQHPDADRLVTSALRALAAADARSYPLTRQVRDAVAEREGVDPAHVLLTAGSDHAIGLIVAAFAAPAGGLLLPCPAFESWCHYANLQNVTVHEVACLTGSPPQLTLDPLRAAMRRLPPSVVAVTDPHSPAGLIAAPGEMQLLAADAQRYGHLLVIDQCYAEFVGVSHVSLLAEHSRVVIVQSYSKAFALAGARVAAVLGAPAVVNYLARFRPDSTLSATALALLNTLLRHTSQFEKVWADVGRIRRRFTADVLADHPQWRALAPGANFVTFQTGQTDIAEYLYRRGYRVRSLHGLPGLDRCVRISLAEDSTMQHVAALLGEVDSGCPR